VQGDLEFNVEVSIMAGLHHAHVVPLLGSCCEADQRVAVFEHMPHGNLRDLLDGKIAAARHFNWPARLNVLLGVAKGLAYLHEVITHASSPVDITYQSCASCKLESRELLCRAVVGIGALPNIPSLECQCTLKQC